MKIAAVDLFHLRIPCRSAFGHARGSRSCSDVVLTRVRAADGLSGWGEILPRVYVTGETIEETMSSLPVIDAIGVIGREIDGAESLRRWVCPLIDDHPDRLALLGGIELALWNLLGSRVGGSGRLDLDRHIGSPRTRPVGRCSTIGMEHGPAEVRKFCMAARLGKVTALKLKVGMDIDRDIACIRTLQKSAGKGVQLRLDGNGALELDAAVALLSAVDTDSLHSIEEPLNRDRGDLDERLDELHSRCGLDLMADESVCSDADAERLIGRRCYQWFNIRLGKHGGLLASCRVRDKAIKAGIGVVGGSMVGETSAMTQASTVFLHRSDAIDYIEGLGQNHSWLLEEPLQASKGASTGFSPFSVDRAAFDRCLISTQSIH